MKKQFPPSPLTEAAPDHRRLPLRMPSVAPYAEQLRTEVASESEIAPKFALLADTQSAFEVAFDFGDVGHHKAYQNAYNDVTNELSSNQLGQLWALHLAAARSNVIGLEPSPYPGLRTIVVAGSLASFLSRVKGWFDADGLQPVVFENEGSARAQDALAKLCLAREAISKTSLDKAAKAELDQVVLPNQESAFVAGYHEILEGLYTPDDSLALLPPGEKLRTPYVRRVFIPDDVKA